MKAVRPVRTIFCRLTLQILLVTGISSPINNAYAGYKLEFKPSAPEPVTLSLELPPHHGTILKTRSTPSEVKNPHCGKIRLRRKAPGQWIVPRSCRKVTWNLHFSNPPADNIGMYLGHHSVAYANWRVIMEQFALLRLADDKNASEIVITQTGRKDMKAYVPSTGNVSEFYVIGNIQEESRIVDGTRIEYMSDDLKRTKQRGILNMHAQAYRALHSLFTGISALPYAQELRVLIIGSADPQGINGSGGARSLVFDYPRDTNAKDAFVLMTAAHEQFHQLRALSMENKGQDFLDAAQYDMWIEEGLAQYYGLKTVQNSKLPDQEKAKTRNTFIDPKRPVHMGLKALNRQFRQGDHSVYPLFYAQGATFFSEIDRVLQEESHGKISLDIYAARISGTKNGDIAPEITKSWRKIAGKKTDALIRHYIGR